MQINYNSPFQIFENKKKINRDNINYGFIYLKKFLKKKNIHLTKSSDKSNLSLHFFKIHKIYSKKNFLILPELQSVQPLNTRKEILKYDKIFTIINQDKINKKFIKVYWPTLFPKINKSLYSSFKVRKFLCNISSNKYTKLSTNLSLYDFRYKDIEWFINNEPLNFDLYGYDWNLIKRNNNLINKITFNFLKYLNKYINFSVRKSFKGITKNKIKTLKKYNFSICYENSKFYKGYITEKIFDCFFAGTIPIYLGPTDINKYIPSNCFIDRRLFESSEKLNIFLKNLDTKEILSYRNNIYKFLKSKKSKIFSYKNFAKIIFKHINE